MFSFLYWSIAIYVPNSKNQFLPMFLPLVLWGLYTHHSFSITPTGVKFKLDNTRLFVLVQICLWFVNQKQIQEKYEHVKCPKLGFSDEDYNEMQVADDNRR